MAQPETSNPKDSTRSRNITFGLATDNETWWTLLIGALLLLLPTLRTGDLRYVASVMLFFLPWVYLTLRKLTAHRP